MIKDLLKECNFHLAFQSLYDSRVICSGIYIQGL